MRFAQEECFRRPSCENFGKKLPSTRFMSWSFLTCFQGNKKQMIAEFDDWKPLLLQDTEEIVKLKEARKLAGLSCRGFALTKG